MKERTFILLSVPDDFIDKFAGFVKNINILNKSSKDPVVKVEGVYSESKPEFAAVPKKHND